jgi:cleavage and polyadenylation specificity factor subunit 3
LLCCTRREGGAPCTSTGLPSLPPSSLFPTSCAPPPLLLLPPAVTPCHDVLLTPQPPTPDAGGLYGEEHLNLAMERTEVVDFHQTIDFDGIRVTPYRAGHVLGAAMFMVEIGGMRLLYTGDYSRVADRHMPAADLPLAAPPHVVVVESTYGVSRHLPRAEREQRFCRRIHEAVARGGRVLLPVVALGRAQELLLILEEYWSRHPDLHAVPIYQTSRLAARALGVYQTYIEMMNDDIKAAFNAGSHGNPFKLKHVTHLKSVREVFDDSGACVVMATPSMLQSGASRELFDEWWAGAGAGAGVLRV